MLAVLLIAAQSLAEPAGVASDTLTVEHCVAIAREGAPAMLAAARMLKAASSDSAATSFNRRPDFSLRAGVLVAPEGFYDPVVTDLGSYELKAGMDWTLSDAGARERSRARSALGLSAARLRSATEARDAGLEAANLALRLERLREAEASQRQSLDWLAGLASLVRSGIASGARGASDSLRVALERDAVDSELEATLLEARTTALELRALLGREGDGPIAIAPVRDVPPAGPTAADSVHLVTVIARQPEIALARISEEERRLDVEEARRGSAPTFDLSLDAGFAGADLTHVVPEGLLEKNPQATFSDRVRQDLGASVAIRLRIPVLDKSLPRRADARAAELDAAGIESRASAANEERRALLLIEAWRSADRRLAATQGTYDRAERNMLKVKSLYGAGAATVLDLLDSRRVFDDARERRADARTAQRWARFQVEDRK